MCFSAMEIFIVLLLLAAASAARIRYVCFCLVGMGDSELLRAAVGAKA